MGEVTTREAKGRPAASRPRRSSPRPFLDVQQSRCGPSAGRLGCCVLVFFFLRFMSSCSTIQKMSWAKVGPLPGLARHRTSSLSSSETFRSVVEQLLFNLIFYFETQVIIILIFKIFYLF
jgi:hypothetical protein